jgi:hypothetical protein
MCLTKIARYEGIELLVSATAGQRVSFTDIPELRTDAGQQVFIKNVEVFPLSAYSASQLNPSVPGMPNAELPKAVLVLYVMGEERIHLIPLAKLIHIQDGVVPFQQQEVAFDDLNRVDWTKSYVQFSANPAGGPYVIPFGVTYVKITN